MTLDTTLVAALRASRHRLPRHTIGGLIPHPLALIPLDGEWLLYTSGRPRCAADLPLTAHLAALDPDELDLLLDPAVPPDEAIMDSAARTARQRGREAANLLARQRLAEQEAEARRADFARRERAAIARVNVTTLDLEDF